MKEKFDSVFADFEANMIDFEETIRNANENNKRILNSDSDLIDRIFYLTLIKNMDAYVARFGSGEELAEARRRLIYALDTPGDKFYVSGNIEKAYSNIDKGEVEPDDFGFVEEEVVIMTKELFLKPEDQYRVKKILFIATYYELTKNRRVKAEFDANKTHKMYKYYYDLILGPSQGKATKRTREK